MPESLDPRALKETSWHLMRTARVLPLRMTALLLALTLGLNLIGAVAGRLLPMAAVNGLPVAFSFFDVLILLINGVLNAGFLLYCLRVRRGESLPYDSLFDAFPFAGKVVLLDVLMWSLIGLGFSLFILPGFMMLFSYSMAMFHLVDEPELSAFEALRRSRAEMRGHKWQLFALFVSFWPLLLGEFAALSVSQMLLGRALPDTMAGDLLYVLLSSLLLALVEIFLTPYLRLTQAGFYEQVKQPAPEAPQEL
ncbi:MAG: DUF975 family protein [Oscillospiraceae bacterium]|nr:DUF975 family protein [Oscillospiraceae bacterium]